MNAYAGHNKGGHRAADGAVQCSEMMMSGGLEGMQLTLVGDGARVLHGGGGGGRARFPELVPGLLLGGLLGVRVGAGVAVEEDVLLERGELVHALELGHADNRLLALSARAGSWPLNIVVGRHLQKNAAIRVVTV
jgi:hypothetical protein